MLLHSRLQDMANTTPPSNHTIQQTRQTAFARHVPECTGSTGSRRKSGTHLDANGVAIAACWAAVVHTTALRKLSNWRSTIRAVVRVNIRDSLQALLARVNIVICAKRRVLDGAIDYRCLLARVVDALSIRALVRVQLLAIDGLTVACLQHHTSRHAFAQSCGQECVPPWDSHMHDTQGSKHSYACTRAGADCQRSREQHTSAPPVRNSGRTVKRPWPWTGSPTGSNSNP